MDSLGHLAQGFAVAAKPVNLLVAFLGSFIGTFTPVLLTIPTVAAQKQ